ncbi:SDR family NAD(P)-dependent oxidoreductase [Nitrosomonadales bacterium]|jgi:NAD(P)-dependent dehydrogenase (short-subunit alcohol dehydrogenase family)|nr:SDR family NAD(P)-dependent oxidoreductase [Nitrosomonadales bacterium]MDA9600554.1 SDR family NAD(P)-dependent oxidoreductase [Nitrosomonadales bacterium]
MKENIIIAGSSGSIGGEFTKQYTDDPNVEKVVTLSRNVNKHNHKKIQSIKIDYNNAESFKNLDEISQLDSISKIIIATGILHTDEIKPEKSIDSIDDESMKRVFQVNVFGPILLVKKLLPLIKKSKGVKVVFLTARVGSVSGNELGGWHSYRSSKSALNMIIKNLSIELKRLNKEHVVIGIHPGTVKSHLSEPFLRHVKHDIFSPKESVDLMTQVVNKVTQKDSGKCFDFSGKVIEP